MTMGRRVRSFAALREVAAEERVDPPEVSDRDMVKIVKMDWIGVMVPFKCNNVESISLY